MKKITLLILAIFCLCVDSYSHRDDDDVKALVPVTLKGRTTIKPRTVDIAVNVDCYYLNGRVFVDFYAPVDDVNLSVTNIYTGEQYDAYSSGSCQSIYVDVPTTSGSYYVEIECDSAAWDGEYYL